MPDLNPQQFHAYRGMLMDNGPAPSDDEILNRLNPKPGYGDNHNLYGDSWTKEQSVAHRFASNPNAGGYQTIPGRQRRIANNYPEEGSWGVVLEAKESKDYGDQSVPYSEHEKETRVHPDTVQEVTAHVYQKTPYRGKRNHPEGLSPKEHFAKEREPIRSVPVPAEHWQTYDNLTRRAPGDQREFGNTPTGRRWYRKPLF